MVSNFCIKMQVPLTRSSAALWCGMAIIRPQGKVVPSRRLLGAAALARALKTPRAAASPVPEQLPADVAPPSTPDPTKASARPRQPMPDPPKTSAPLRQPMPDPPKSSATPRQPMPDPPEARFPPQPRQRQLPIFFLVFVLAAVALAGAWMTWGPALLPAPGRPQTSDAAAPPPVAPASQQQTACPLQPAVVAASDTDGRFPLQAGVSGLIAADIASFIVIGNEAVAAGRPRDAEAAFLMSCRVADKLGGAGSVGSADAKYHLGSHYSRLAHDGGVAAAADRAELLGRAEPLLQDSLQTYVANYGQAHEKSQLAAQGLAGVRQVLPQAQKVQDVPATATAPVSVPVSESARDTGGPEKLPPPAPPGAGTAQPASPSPTTGAKVETRQDSTAAKKCSQAVAILGLCNPDQ